MEFWPENQGQSPVYAKFGTLPGRNFSHNYHDRHQATQYPLYYGEQQEQGRESGYWTAPGSRAQGALQEYTTWMDPELSAPTSSHFPFILDSHAQRHQHLGEYQPREARDREWTADQRTAKEYERGFLRDGWQRRWEPCSSVPYSRDVSTKRSSYRELEAWAARYSHSLPRRRRIEAELRGASQGLVESSRAPLRDTRTEIDPRVATLQQLRQSGNIKQSGVWDTSDQLQTLNYYSSQAPVPERSHMLDIKDRRDYPRRLLSQPPGYVAPPPYNSPHNSTPVMHQCDTTWEREGKRQSYWSQPTFRKDVSVELQYTRKGEKEHFTNPDGNKTCAELDGVKHRRQEIDSLKAVSPVSAQNTTMQHGSTLQTIKAVQNTNEQTSSKIIEGRKFRLNKKTGGMTIFCLVSRLAGVTETPSLPLCISQTNIQSTDLGGSSKGLQDSNDNQTNPADEVDFKEPTLAEHSNTSDGTNVKVKQKETQTNVNIKMLGDKLSNKEETDSVSAENNNLTDANSTFGRESKQPVSVRYPLWREPSFTSKDETGGLKVHSEDGKSDGLPNQEECDVEVRKLDTESEDSKGLLVIDTACVVVKMELIPSPKKEHVHFLGCTGQTEHSALDIQTTTSLESNNHAVTPDENKEKKSFQINEPVTDPHSDPTKKTSKNESDIFSPGLSTSSVCETLEERAQRILGISLYDEQQPEDATSPLGLCVEEQDEEVEPSPIHLNDALGQLPEETTEEEQSQNHLEVSQTEDAVCLTENDDAKDQVINENSENLAESQEQPCKVSDENDIDSQQETDIKMLQETMTEDNQLEATSGEGKTEQSVEENLLSVADDSSSQQFSSSEHFPNSSVLSHSDFIALPYVSESNTGEGLDPELSVSDTAESLAPRPETSPLPRTALDQLPSPIPPGSTESSPASTPHTDHSPSPPPLPLSLIDEIPESTLAFNLCTENQDAPSLEDLPKDMTVELMSEQQSVNDQPDDPACVAENSAAAEQQTKEADPLDVLEQTLEISGDNGVDISILQVKCVKADDVAYVKESYVSEKQMERESLEMEIHLDNMTRREEHFDSEDEEDDASSVKESSDAEEESQTDADDIPARLLEEKILQENQTQIEILQDFEPQSEPSGLDCDVAQAPLDVLSHAERPSPPHVSHKAVTEPISVLEMDSVFPSALTPDAADNVISEPVPPLYLDCIEEFSFPSESPWSCTPNPERGGESISIDLPNRDKPVSLWDAVNRIRKHTAPDSENEDEEVSELWDPESLGEDLGCPDVEEELFDEAGQQEASTSGSVEDVEVGQIQEDACHEELSGHAEEDTLSCSSTSSHGSGDTVIVAEGDGVEETIPDAETETKLENDEEFDAAELEAKTAGEEDKEELQDERDTNVFCLSEECTAEVETLTAGTVEMMETEQKENEDISTPSEISVVSHIDVVQL